jgi:chromosome segregation ATPase
MSDTETKPDDKVEEKSNAANEQDDAVDYKEKFTGLEARLKKEVSGRDAKIAEFRKEIEALRAEQKKTARSKLSAEDLKKEYDREIAELKEQADAEIATRDAKYAELEKNETIRQAVAKMSENVPSWLLNWKLESLPGDPKEIQDSFRDIVNRIATEVQYGENFKKAGEEPRTGTTTSMPKGVVPKEKWEAMPEELRRRFYEALPQELKTKQREILGAA